MSGIALLNPMHERPHHAQSQHSANTHPFTCACSSAPPIATEATPSHSMWTRRLSCAFLREGQPIDVALDARALMQVLELLLRYGWCCDPVPTAQRAAVGDPPQPECACSSYSKAEYANLAHTFGLRWLYLDPLFIPPPQSFSPIDRSAVVVDAEELARVAEEVMQRAASRR